ncbi:MAG: SsrA-binding protein SmpB [Thermoleophilia bacterium]|nr:SsrA-binding protein SmpB [Thermoleophilia bacterium]
MGKTAKTKAATAPPRKDIAQNRKALHEYEILGRYEAGIALTGTEVKGLRESGAMIREAYAHVINHEVFLIGAHISDYGPAGGRGHDPQRTRRLLLHRREIEKIAGQVAEKGISLIPLRMYWNDEGRAKIELGIGRGRTQYDKRMSIKDKEVARELSRANARRGRG